MSRATARRAEMSSESEQARQINALHKKFLATKSELGARYWDVGHALLEAKKKRKHGEWEPWVRKHLAFDERQAQKYMRFAKYVSRAKAKSEPEDAFGRGLAGALDALAERHYCASPEYKRLTAAGHQRGMASSAQFKKQRAAAALHIVPPQTPQTLERTTEARRLDLDQKINTVDYELVKIVKDTLLTPTQAHRILGICDRTAASMRALLDGQSEEEASAS